MLFKKLQKFWEFGSGHMVLAAFCAHSVSISIGICQGYSAILIPQLIDSAQFHISDEESSWLASLGAITNPIGSVLSGLLAEYCGRKRSIQISSIPFLIGWICISYANNITWLYAGRLISGVAAGMSAACYTYVSEVSLPESRGFLQTLGPICASFGILLTYTLGYFLLWSTIAKISIFFSIFTLISVQFLPESPLYLLQNYKNPEAFQSYLWLRRSNVVAQQEIEQYNKVFKEKIASSSGSSLKDIYLSPQTVKPFFILVFLFLLQELSGIYTILFYAVSFFQETNLEMDEYVSSIIVGGIRFTMSIVAAILINKFGRRVLCMSSSFGMALTMLMVAGYMKYYEVFAEETRMFTFIPLVGVILNVVFSMVGMLPIPWILVGELFPLEVRPIMGGIVICIAQCFIFICVKVYNDMLHFLTFSGTLFLFVVSSMVSLLFCKYFLPETKNKSLSDIEKYFVSKEKHLLGFDNKAFVLQPEKKSGNEEGIYSIEVQK